MVLDSGVVAALFFKDPSSEKVDAAVGRYANLYTLDLAYAEVCSVAWKRVKLFGEDAATSARALTLARDFVGNACHVARSSELLHQAFELGVEERINAYDSLFLSLAKKSKAKLLTTDKKLHRMVEASPKIAGLTMMP